MSEKVTTEKIKTEKVESLPDGWKRVRLGEVIYFKNGKSPSFLEFGTYPIYGSNGLIGFSNIYQFEGEHLIIGRVGASGEVHFVSGRFFASDNCLVGHLLREKELNLRYAFYYLKYFDLKRFITQTAQPLITQSLINNLFIEFPPLPEQRKIAEILETVDNAIEKTDAIIEKYRRIKKGLMADLLTGKIRLIPYGHSEAEGEESPLLTSPEAKKFVIGDKTFVAVPNQKWKNSPIGKIPEDWEVRKLGEIGEIVSGYTFPISFQGKDYGQYPFVKVDDLNIDNKFILGAKNYIDDYERNFLGIMVFPPSTIVFPKIGMAVYLNKFRILKVNAVFDNNITGVIFERSICSPEFYYFYFAAKIDLKKIAYETALPSIPTQALKSLLLPLPPLSEQQLIADVLSQVDEVIEKEIQYKEKLERIKKGLMEDLLTGKVRVNNLIKEG